MTDKPVGGLVWPAVVAGAVGLAFVGYQQSARTDQSNIDQLPALQTQVSGHDRSIDTVEDEQSRLRDTLANIQQVLAQQLDRAALDDIFQGLNDAIVALEEQLNRRIQLEVKEPIYRALSDMAGRLTILDQGQEYNEDKILDLSERVSEFEAMMNLLSR